MARAILVTKKDAAERAAKVLAEAETLLEASSGMNYDPSRVALAQIKTGIGDAYARLAGSL